MTGTEQYAEIGRMFVEREEAQLRLACIENRMRRMKAALAAAVRAIDGEPWESEAEYPQPDAISHALRERNEVRRRLGELEKFFSSRGASSD